MNEIYPEITGAFGHFAQARHTQISPPPHSLKLLAKSYHVLRQFLNVAS
jgi:hypothetical protein